MCSPAVWTPQCGLSHLSPSPSSLTAIFSLTSASSFPSAQTFTKDIPSFKQNKKTHPKTQIPNPSFHLASPSCFLLLEREVGPGGLPAFPQPTAAGFLLSLLPPPHHPEEK